jgi:hypothetical protein
MTIPERNEALTTLVRQFVAMVRRLLAADGPEVDAVDRVLAAATIAAGALAVAWPRGHKLPRFITGALRIVHQVWQRRAWWAEP